VVYSVLGRFHIGWVLGNDPSLKVRPYPRSWSGTKISPKACLCEATFTGLPL